MKDIIIMRKYKNKFTHLKVIGWIQVFMLFVAYSIYRNPEKGLLEGNLFLTFFVFCISWFLYLKYKHEPKNIIDLEVSGKVKEADKNTTKPENASAK